MNMIDVLMPDPMQFFVIEEVEKRYRLHKLWCATNPEAIVDQIRNDVQFILCAPGGTRINGAYMEQYPKLKGVINFGVGYDSIDVTWAAQHKVIVTNTPDVLNEEVADLAIGLLIAVIRQIPQADRYVRAGLWIKSNFPLSPSLIGRTMGIVGLGRIGKAIAKRAEAFGLKIIYHGRHQQRDIAYQYYDDLIAMAGDSDILMLVAPGTAATQHMVSKDVLTALGPQGVLINMARGSLVDEEVLIEALEMGTILSAGLDVYAQEHHVPRRLIDLPQVVLLPHVGSASTITRQAMSKLVVDNLDALAAGQKPLTPVPETPIV